MAVRRRVLRLDGLVGRHLAAAPSWFLFAPKERWRWDQERGPDGRKGPLCDNSVINDDSPISGPGGQSTRRFQPAGTWSTAVRGKGRKLQIEMPARTAH